MVFVCVG